MAPPMKDLPRWLEENPEFAVAPDWTDIVKQSVSTNPAFPPRKGLYKTVSLNSSLFSVHHLIIQL